MIRGWAIAVLAAGCGRVGFDRATPDGSGTGDMATIEDAPGSLIDDVFTAGETTSLVIDRGTTASYFNADGTLVYAGPEEPRFEHDPITHEPLGLLVESSAFNDTHLSEQLDDGLEWFSNGLMSVTPNVEVAPDGTLTADGLVDADTTMQSRRAQTYVIPNDMAAYTCSVFVKAGTQSRATLGCEVLGGGSPVQTAMTFDFASGSITESPPGAIAFGLEPAGSGWFRAWIAIQNNATGNTSAALSFWNDFTSDASTGTYYGWGAQFEAGDRPTSYIPNPTTSRMLRGLEGSRLFIPPSLIRNGSVRVVARPKYDVKTPAACVIAVGSQRVCVDRDPTLDAMSIDVIGTSTATFAHGAWPLGTSRWGAFTYDYDQMTVSGISDNGTSDATWTLAGVASQIKLGIDDVNKAVVHLQRVTVWTAPISAAELSALSP